MYEAGMANKERGYLITLGAGYSLAEWRESFTWDARESSVSSISS